MGHICVNYGETEHCGCGNQGCLEQYGSATGIVRLARKKLENEERETLLTKAEITAKSIFDAVKAEDAVAMENLESIWVTGWRFWPVLQTRLFSSLAVVCPKQEKSSFLISVNTIKSVHSLPISRRSLSLLHWEMMQGSMERQRW